MRLTETGTFLAAMIALVGGFLFLLQKGGQILDYSRLAHHSFSVMAVGHKITIASIGMLIALQIIRLIIVTLNFASERDWIYVVMGTFILVVIGYSLM